MNTTPLHKSFDLVLEKYRSQSFSERDKGARFERLMAAYLRTDPQFAGLFKEIWLWDDFFAKSSLGGADTGIDIVALTVDDDYWAIQCKCLQADAYIDKAAVDTFLSTSSRLFHTSPNVVTGFTRRYWISTSNNWSAKAEDTIKNQMPPVSRINLSDLQQAAVDWAKLEEGLHGEAARLEKKQLRPHQIEALNKTHEHFKTADRGKLIMACGTGKTLNSLRIAENETGGKGLILFLVPSIALLGQTLREWCADAQNPINPICICSDPEVSKKKTKIEDTNLYNTVDLALPASTKVEEIIKQFQHAQKHGNSGMTVVFSTYHSIEVIAKAQAQLRHCGLDTQSRNNQSKIEHQKSIFDLIICDEAHRTTGVTLSGEDESAFTKVHDNNFIKAKKRLYMTATPRLYSDDNKAKAKEADAILCSMDDVDFYGEEIYRIGFGEAVEKGLLSDYKVLVLSLNDNDLPPAVVKMIEEGKTELDFNDTSRLIGCVNALAKQIVGDDTLLKSDPEPMRRAVAFCPTIEKSKNISKNFVATALSYIGSLQEENQSKMISVATNHVDGKMSACERDKHLSWLKATPADGECRILSNVRCLCEGVDVPALDAVMFLSPKNSQIDVVQAVGRVMRKAPGKNFGYIIIPVIIPSNIKPEVALNDNERYKVVWTVLNALRAHDDRFNAIVNKIDLNKSRPLQIGIGRPKTSFDGDGNPFDFEYDTTEHTIQLKQEFENLQNVVFARMVQKVGDRRYWEQWAKSVAEIAEMQIKRITEMVQTGNYRCAFEKFLTGLQKNINPSIDQSAAIEMLSQHIITRPVFDALFEGYSFVKNNPISVSMQSMLDLLEASVIEKDTEKLARFYASVKKRASGIDNAEGKQRIILELYDTFFKTAFPKMAERLGIVYTPVPVVDFIIHSVNDVLKSEFGRSLTDENVNIIDPFTGTGTFITRLLQSGLIRPEDLTRKYKHEIFANEIVLLAYYIAAVNIENVYHDAIAASLQYVPFDGICLTDTFQLGETDEATDMFSEQFPHNSERVIRQKKTPITVIMGNPPYSIGQKSANDNAQNQAYPILDKSIKETYVKFSSAGLNKASYDPYRKAFRWSTDRLKNDGIIAFVTNGAWLDSNDADGFRKCIEQEFSSIYVFNLRGNCRTSGELRQKEAGNVFGLGSRTPIAITLLVNKSKTKGDKATIYYYNVGDYHNRDQKLEIIKNLKSFKFLTFETLQPNEHGDWISQRSDAFSEFIPLEPEKKFDANAKSFFNLIAIGVATNRDAWVLNFCKEKLCKNMQRMIDFYNEQSLAYIQAKQQNPDFKVENFIDTNNAKISWTVNLKKDVERSKVHQFYENGNCNSMYRPFTKQWLYYDRPFIERPGLWSQIFPTKEHKNLIICVSNVGNNKENCIFISNILIDLNCLNAGAQCFPLYWYEHKDFNKQKDLFSKTDDISGDYIRHDAITDYIHTQARLQYGNSVTKEDIFYYVYGFLHCPAYRETFAADLKKMLPRLPLVASVDDFWAFSQAGRDLADLHLNYENIGKYPGVLEMHQPMSIDDTLAQLGKDELQYVDYRVEKMRFSSKDQKDAIIYNSRITIENIPAQAYEYIVNGKSAIEWIMERYQITKHKESGIVNDPNDWAIETENPRYILDLLHSVINLSVQTVEIVKGLPKVNF